MGDNYINSRRLSMKPAIPAPKYAPAFSSLFFTK